MTQNLNMFISNMETERANKARERETARHNLATEQETYRANRAAEAHNRNVLHENIRHALMTEMQARFDLSERKRAAQESERNRRAEIAAMRARNSDLALNERARITNDYILGSMQRTETRRSNLASESLRRRELEQMKAYQTGQLFNTQMKNANDLRLGLLNYELQSNRLDVDRFIGMRNLDINKYDAETRRKRMYLDAFTSLGSTLLRTQKGGLSLWRK